ncbi:MAG: fatty acid desaturase [Nodosilinea sp.]
MKSNNRRAVIQILNTVIPYVVLWVLAVQVKSVSGWLLAPIIVVMALFLGRCFSLMHDCGHYSLFSSKRVNRVVGFGLGVMNAIPQYPWSRGHAYHHKTNGDWNRYRGPSALLSTDEFAQLSAGGQRRYELLRHPLIIFPGGFFYLAIKPRLALAAGTGHFIGYFFTGLIKNPRAGITNITLAYKARHWYTAAEFWDLLLNNICVIGGWIILGHWLGYGFFFGVYFTSLTLAAAICICIFFVQHNFEESYAHTTAGWDYLKGALEGSSHLALPRILRWFTADIGYHNIHHLSARIPNYNLADCHQRNSYLLVNSKTLYLGDIPRCFKFILWDESANRLQSIAGFRQASSP